MQSGHLTSVRGRTGGTFVSDRPPLAERDEDPLGSDAAAVIDHRVAIEVGSTILAAERADGPDLDALDVLVKQMADEAGASSDYRRADIRFHIGVAEAAHSPQLVSEMTDVQGRMSDLIALIAHPEEVLTRSNAQHQRLCQAPSNARRGGGRGAHPRAHPGNRAHPRRPALRGAHSSTRRIS